MNMCFACLTAAVNLIALENPQFFVLDCQSFHLYNGVRVNGVYTLACSLLIWVNGDHLGLGTYVLPTRYWAILLDNSIFHSEIQ